MALPNGGSGATNGITQYVRSEYWKTIAQQSANPQWLQFDNENDRFGYYSYPGSPEGNVTADKGSFCSDTNNGEFYIKTTDGVNTGWKLLKGTGFTWSDISGAFSALNGNGYFITGTSTATLPASPSNGDTIEFFVDHASQVLTIQATGTQIIRMGTVVSAAAGSAVSTQRGDSVELVYRSTNTCWQAVDFVGTWIV